MQAKLPAHDLVLIGAGHTNMHIVRMWRMQPIRNVQLTLVSPFGRATYSGMLPGTLAGLYASEDMSIDLWRFCTSCGVRLIVDQSVGIDPERRRVLFNDRPPLRFDVASIGIGSVPTGGGVWTRNPQVLSIKPMTTFLARLEEQLQRVLERHAAGERPIIDLTIVGGGAAGIEVSFCLEAHLRRRGINAQVRLVEGGTTILPGYLSRTARLVRREFGRRGIDVMTGETATAFDDGRLEFQSGDAVETDLVVWAAGAAPPPVLERFDLPKADDGFLAVRRTLQSTGHERVFVVGDTATFVDAPLPKAGVYAVREGPVLWRNIKHVLRGEPLEAYDPQQEFLSLLSTGDGRAVAQYKGFAFHNRLMWKWKDYIDRKFMRKYQDYRPMTPETTADRTDQPGGRAGAAPTMRCKGCGGKVGANVLSAAIERLEIPPSRFALRGLDHPDDAALLDPAAGAVDVLSVDFFQAFLDDPYVVGRVAALNALSDLWAMGSEPVGALAMVTLPEGEPRQQAELLYQLLAGGLRELSAAGATLLGGHTTEGADLTIGYTVVGRLDGQSPTAKSGLKPGDRLILTKPLGTGTLLAAHMQSLAQAEWMDALLASLLESNAAAARVAREHGAIAVTDVTGFGLAGHLFEMLDASGVSASLSLDALPLLPGFAELAARRIESTLAPANREVESRIETAAPEMHDDPRFAALFDPQTSGGLLLAVPASAVAAMLDELARNGRTPAALIGEVTGRSDAASLALVKEL